MAQRALTTSSDVLKETTFAIEEIGLLIEALAMSASRHESQARSLARGWAATDHDDKAIAMRKLRLRLMKQRVVSR